MYELDKEKVGKFIAELRKEKGLTQKELAEQLKVSDKTISKWETANGMPDVSMLMPIADLFGVTVTELLQGQRMLQTEKMNVGDVDALLKQTLQLTEEEKQKGKAERQKNVVPFLVCLVIAFAEIGALYFWKGRSGIGINTPIFVGLAAFFGGYYINNRNWPHVVKAAQWGTNMIMVLYPIVRFIMVLILQNSMGMSMDLVEMAVGMPIFFGLLFVPLVVAAKKNI